jgi:hypothetical protein
MATVDRRGEQVQAWAQEDGLGSDRVRQPQRVAALCDGDANQHTNAAIFGRAASSRSPTLSLDAVKNVLTHDTIYCTDSCARRINVPCCAARVLVHHVRESKQPEQQAVRLADTPFGHDLANACLTHF